MENKNNRSRTYDALSAFLERLFGLAALFEVPIENEQFAKILPRIPYQTYAIRQDEFVLRERIFKGREVPKVFSQVDAAVYHAEYVLRDIYRPPEREHNLAISRELTDAAVAVGKMVMEGYARLEKEKEKQRKLGGLESPSGLFFRDDI